MLRPLAGSPLSTVSLPKWGPCSRRTAVTDTACRAKLTNVRKKRHTCVQALGNPGGASVHTGFLAQVLRSERFPVTILTRPMGAEARKPPGREASPRLESIRK